IANRENGHILVWEDESSIPTRDISANLINPWSLFVTTDGDIYINNGNNRVDKWALNATYSELEMEVDSLCTGLFVDINYNLYCKSMNNHRVVKMPLNDEKTIPRRSREVTFPEPKLVGSSFKVSIDALNDDSNNFGSEKVWITSRDLPTITIAGTGC